MVKDSAIGAKSSQAAAHASGGEMSPSKFSAAATSAAQAVPMRERFGEGKVFISDAWHVARERPEFRGMTLDEFKSHLVDANRSRKLDLARADLVEAMDPAKVAASETLAEPHRKGTVGGRGAVFHFIVIR